MVTLRPADNSDSGTLWAWRNDLVTRQFSARQDEVSWEDHRRWFAGVLSDPARTVLIASDHAGERVGMVRFDSGGGIDAVISVNIAPDRRGQGIGQLVLHEALAWHASVAPGLPITALIRTSNEASIRLFAAEGFTEVERSAEFVTLRSLVAPRA